MTENIMQSVGYDIRNRRSHQGKATENIRWSVYAKIEPGQSTGAGNVNLGT